MASIRPDYSRVDNRLAFRSSVIVRNSSKRTSNAEASAVLAAGFFILALLYLIGGSHHGAWYENSRIYGFGLLLIALISAVRAWRAFRKKKENTP
jgi:membrane protease YdiL (CAAX protease family)